MLTRGIKTHPSVGDFCSFPRVCGPVATVKWHLVMDPGGIEVWVCRIYIKNEYAAGTRPEEDDQA